MHLNANFFFSYFLPPLFFAPVHRHLPLFAHYPRLQCPSSTPPITLWPSSMLTKESYAIFSEDESRTYSTCFLRPRPPRPPRFELIIPLSIGHRVVGFRSLAWAYSTDTHLLSELLQKCRVFWLIYRGWGLCDAWGLCEACVWPGVHQLCKRGPRDKETIWVKCDDSNHHIGGEKSPQVFIDGS